jgi:DNA-directed RNA polymerase subunit omega
MRNPSIDKLLDIVDSKYKLVLLAAKRAKNIEQESPILITKPRSKKPVGISLEEIMADKLQKTE